MNKFNDEDAQAVWEITKGYKPDLQLDTEAGLRRLQNRMAAEGVGKVVPMRGRWMRAAAAAIVLAVVAFAGLQFFGSNAEWVTVTAQNDRQQVTLPDGSQVWLKENAQLSYVDGFAGDSRQLRLEGEAFFDVTKNPTKPFIIQAGEGTVTVLGTSFSVDTDASSTEVLVKTGKVAFQANEEIEPVLLTKNMKAEYEKGEKAPFVENKVSLNKLAWQTGVLQYRSVALKQILSDVEVAYNVSIELTNSNLSACEYTDIIQLEGKTVEQALSGLLTQTNLKLDENNGVYRLSGGKSSC
ncbi:MAG: transmembrane sensor [Saprospiraceae bacterium]|jgi:transmembrane sensor